VNGYGVLWRLAEFVFVSNQLHRSTWLRVLVLRWFGATIGSECLIRPCRVRLPYNLSVGDRCWIGERVCIGNPAKLTIGSDSCVSQECFLVTGSHDLTTMDEIVSPITIGDGVWLTTRTIVISDGIHGLTIADGVVVTPGSVVTRSLNGSTLEARIVYGGNPVRKIREFSTQPEDNHATV
jgi:putative colanic acid biosynthesis acetyltransferase WcaF